MDKLHIGTHRAHCCRKHGCKYGNDDCPVVSGAVKQLYSCERGNINDDDCYHKTIVAAKLNEKQCSLDITFDDGSGFSLVLTTGAFDLLKEKLRLEK